MAKIPFLEGLLINTLLLTVVVVATLDNPADFRVGRKQLEHYSAELSEEQFITVSRLTDTKHLRDCIKNILIPRVVGSDGHKRVREYIVQSLRDLEWTVDVHKFHEKTPVFGKLHFHNIIAKLNPDAERFLVLSCHYDSKYMPDFEFLGATDSAVPCAILINLAQVLQKQLKILREENISLMLIFFDGEEAFKEWGPHDSIYGARNLAKKWDEERFLDRIDMMMLLDLIGTPDPKFYSFFRNTEPWYSRLLTIEDRLSNSNLMERYASNGVTRHYPDRYFQPNSIRASQVEDDHIPFLRRNVPILHLIPLPFPDCWHTSEDNESVIDFATTENIARIVRVFTMEYLLGSASMKK